MKNDNPQGGVRNSAGAMRCRIRHIVVFLCLVPALLRPFQNCAQHQKPNIIFICTDDQAWWTLGISGNPQAHTPHIDRLAKEGAYLKNSFVTTPVCSPSRSGIFTGRYSSENNIPDFIVNPEHKLFTPVEGTIGLDSSHTTFASLLADAGYQTGLVGKWHLGDWTQDASRKFHPSRFGFRYFMGLTGGGTSASDAPLEENGVVRVHKGLTDDILTNNAIGFIESNKDHPFLLCLMYRAPHSPWLPVAPEDWSPYENMNPVIPNPDYPGLDTVKVKKMTREYLASVTAVDRNIGHIMAALRQLNLLENTIVVFTSDNGNNMGHNGIWHKGNGIWVTRTLPPATPNIASEYRPNMYDNSLRVPAIVKWPGKVNPGTLITNTVTNLDWFPTILQMAGVAPPENITLRGRSIVPLLKGEKTDTWNNDLYAEYSMIHYSRAFMRCYRTKDWKLIRDFLNPDMDELYDLTRDPGERYNLIQSRDKKIKRVVKYLDKNIREHMTRLHDPLWQAIKDNRLQDYPYRRE